MSKLEAAVCDRYVAPGYLYGALHQKLVQLDQGSACTEGKEPCTSTASLQDGPSLAIESDDARLDRSIENEAGGRQAK